MNLIEYLGVTPTDRENEICSILGGLLLLIALFPVMLICLGIWGGCRKDGSMSIGILLVAMGMTIGRFYLETLGF